MNRDLNSFPIYTFTQIKTHNQYREFKLKP